MGLSVESGWDCWLYQAEKNNMAGGGMQGLGLW